MGRIYRKETQNTKSKIKAKSVQKTRKQLRKEKRQQKKLSKAEYYQRKKLKNQSGKTLEISGTGSNKSMKINDKNDVEQVPWMKTQKRWKPKDTKEERIQKNVKKQRMVQLKQANLEEDKTIKHLEKQLKLNKRKTKSIPKSFISDGLDCILIYNNFYI